MLRGLARAAIFGAISGAILAAGSPARADAACPTRFDAVSGVASLPCVCPAEATAQGQVWGADVYTADSSICRAAVHAGMIDRRGGRVLVLPAPGRSAYPGTQRNGVASQRYGAWGASFRFAPPAAAAATLPSSPVGSGSAGLAACPSTFDPLLGKPAPTSCVCPAEAIEAGSVWGVDVYTADSSICRAALHAGMVDRNGGRVVVVAAPGRTAYPGSQRNGVVSQRYGSWGASFRFSRLEDAVAPMPAPLPPPLTTSQAVLAACPRTFDPLLGTADSTSCACAAEAVDGGAVWGVDVYTADSSICAAAVHAGVIDRSGGRVVVVAEPGRPSYPGAARNGINSNSYGTWGASFRFVRPQPTTVVAEVAPPAPAPSIASSLRATAEPAPGVAPAAGPLLAPSGQAPSGQAPPGQATPGQALPVMSPAPSPGPAGLLPPMAPAAPGSRVALVIGNGAYSAGLPPLPNPANDARDIGAALAALGFDVTLAVDAPKAEMEEKLAAFAKAARRSDVALAFYAGHGLQHQGVNYLAPVDAKIEDETDLRRRFLKVQDLIEELQNARGARILLLDACRDSDAVRQLAAALPKSRAAGVRRGLAGEKAEGILIAFATQSDRTAADGAGRNSPFTEALLKHLPTPGQEIRTMFTRVRSEVLRATGGTQRPEVSDSLDGEFAFR